MAKGDIRTAGRKRKSPTSEAIAKRVAKCCLPQAPEGVQPLASGFFLLEGMRTNNVATAKARKASRAKVKGK